MIMNANILLNPTLDLGEPHIWEGHQEVRVPADWQFDCRQLINDDAIPEVRFDTFVVGGGEGEESGVLKVFNQWRTHRWALWQKVNVVPEATYQFTVRLWAWSSEGHEPNVSVNGSYRTWLTVHNGEEVVSEPPPPEEELSDELKLMDGWVLREIDFTAKTRHVTVMVCGDAEWPVTHNDCYLDWARLEMIEAPSPVPDDVRERLAAVESAIERMNGRISDVENWIESFS